MMKNLRRLALSSELVTRAKRKMGDYEKYDQLHNPALQNLSIPGVTIVRDRKSAMKVIDILTKYPDRLCN
jgi:hypothetical protein